MIVYLLLIMVYFNPFMMKANQWTGFYMITASVMKGLRIFYNFSRCTFEAADMNLTNVNVRDYGTGVSEKNIFTE